MQKHQTFRYIIEKNRLIIILLISLFVTFQTASGQNKSYKTSLSKALNTIFANLPDSCKKLYGIRKPGNSMSYQSKINLPGSVENRFDVGVSVDYPLIFMSYVPAGNNKSAAIIRLKKIGVIIAGIKIVYNKKIYKIQFSGKESTVGDDPDYKYGLQNPPPELADTKIYIRLAEADSKTYQYQFTMGVYVKNNPIQNK